MIFSVCFRSHRYPPPPTPPSKKKRSNPKKLLTRDLENDMKDAEYEEKTAQADYAKLMEESQATILWNAYCAGF